VVQVNGKRVRTAGIEAEQLTALWDSVERYGKEKVAEALKAFGVEKSVYLFKEEAQQVLTGLNGVVVPPGKKSEVMASA
jgi:hypothetical protein